MAIMGELGEVPIILHGFVYLLSYWHRTSNTTEDRLEKQALTAVMNDSQISVALLRNEWLLCKFAIHFTAGKYEYRLRQFLKLGRRCIIVRGRN